MPRFALNTELSPSGDAPPARVELIPPGPEVIGRDKRRWLFDAQAGEAVLGAFKDRGVPLPIDWNHATQLSAPSGGESPAAAWIEGLAVVDGALVGDVRWNDRGGAQVMNREYRYLSPVFDYDPATGRIARLVSAGLTNTPNLHLPALNSEEETPMKLSAAIAAALGLAADATEDAGLAAIATMKTATNAEQVPSLDRYVPRADYDALQGRATNAETALRDRDTADLKAKTDAAITAALAAGKITPATEAYHRAACSDTAGLERFQAFVSTAPVIAPDAAVKDRKVEGNDTALNAEERAVCQATGLSEADFIKARTVAA